VNPDTPVALRYQVEPLAKPAKFGHTRRSTLPLESSSDASGNSSKKIITTGGRSPGATATPPAGAARAGSTSLEVGEASTNSSANTSGAGAR
jgi:hypothetical protein